MAKDFKTIEELVYIFITILVGFRYICSHDGHLYCTRVKGHGFDHLLNALAIVLPNREAGEMTDRIFDKVEMFRGAISPESLNAMYTDENDIQLEYRQ